MKTVSTIGVVCITTITASTSLTTTTNQHILEMDIQQEKINQSSMKNWSNIYPAEQTIALKFVSY